MNQSGFPGDYTNAGHSLGMNYNTVLEETLSVWCPNYPRNCSKRSSNTQGWGQTGVSSSDEMAQYIRGIEGEAPGFVSVYSFPEGHTSDGDENVPLIDTLMFDLDFEGSKDASNADWERDMSDLLVRTRLVAKRLIENDRNQYWRASLSGHKGVHLYLDFPAIEREEGTSHQFRNGVENYTEDLIESLKDETGLSDLNDYIDVVSGNDFARLTRLPNTIHSTATERFGESRFCVPVTIKELSEITVEDYVDLTLRPRRVPEECHRVENQRVHDILTKEVRMAEDESSSGDNYSSRSYDGDQVEEYKNNIVDESVTIETMRPSLRDCCLNFYERSDKFAHGSQSHVMENNCILEMIAKNAPIDTMVRFFSESEDFDEEYTRNRIKKMIAYDYSPYTTQKLQKEAGVFFSENE